ncbi:MAG: hypothetical protein HKN11_21100 [Rhizobiales bacterium]|nr:hypothetical protein [Hyphomicrobiales bacterium]
MAGAEAPHQSGSSARLYVIMARKAPVAAVIRRGPSKRVMLSKWDMKNDHFEDGQWFKGRIYERRCDLAAAGDHFIYFAGNFKPPMYTWTAISTLPWLTAHALWAEGDTWGGGGLFALSKCIALCGHQVGDKPTKGKLPRPWTKVIPASEYGRNEGVHAIEDIRMMRDGWVREQTRKWKLNDSWWQDKAERFRFDAQQSAIWSKTNAAGTVLRFVEAEIGERDGRWHVCRGHITFDNGKELDLGEIDWADFDHNGDLLYAFDGGLYRRGKKGESDARLVRDFNDLAFCERVAPYDERPKDNSWHPLDDD